MMWRLPAFEYLTMMAFFGKRFIIFSSDIFEKGQEEAIIAEAAVSIDFVNAFSADGGAFASAAR